MVKFEFILDDAAAENLINCIQDEISDLNFGILMGKYDESLVDWTKRRIEYMENIKQTICSGSSRL